MKSRSGQPASSIYFYGHSFRKPVTRQTRTEKKTALAQEEEGEEGEEEEGKVV